MSKMVKWGNAHENRQTNSTKGGVDDRRERGGEPRATTDDDLSSRNGGAIWSKNKR